MIAPEIHALQHACTVCLTHEEALREALHDLGQRSLTAADLGRLSKEDRRLLDQFAYRYTRLQDDMGARLMPAALRAMGEEIAARTRCRTQGAGYFGRHHPEDPAALSGNAAMTVASRAQ